MFKNLRIFISLMPIIALLLALAPETAPVLAQETIVFQAQSSQPVLISTDCPEGVEGVCFNFETSGAANIMGPATWTINVVQESFPVPCTEDTAEITLVGATGSIKFLASDTVCAGPSPLGFPFFGSGVWQITGGTGEFEGITGSGTGHVVIQPNGKHTTHLSGTVSH
jgi:hypothetical protein